MISSRGRGDTDIEQQTTPERLACLIAARNLGDILIWSGLMKILAGSGYADGYIVWTRPQAAWMFDAIPNCRVICSPFPVGTTGRFRSRDWLDLVRAGRRVKSLVPSVSIDFVGDFRERLFARLSSSPRHLHIGWDRLHPYRRLIRNPVGAGSPLVVVPPRVPNVYDAYQLMLRALLGRRNTVAAAPSARSGEIVRVGLHPFASQDCKKWPAANWLRLAEGLLSRHMEVVAFSASNERAELSRIFSAVEGRISTVSGDLGQFALAVSKLDAMVGLDSFAIHMAHRQCVRSILINAGAPPVLWTPPDGRILARSGGCVRYPCYNVAPCRGTPGENACVNAISPDDVFAVIDSMRAEGLHRG